MTLFGTKTLTSHTKAIHLWGENKNAGRVTCDPIKAVRYSKKFVDTKKGEKNEAYVI